MLYPLPGWTGMQIQLPANGCRPGAGGQYELIRGKAPGRRQGRGRAAHMGFEACQATSLMDHHATVAGGLRPIFHEGFRP